MVRRLCIVFLLLAAGVPPLAAQSYRYDDAGRLVRVAYMQGGGAVYQYDISNNMTAVMPLDLLPAPTIEAVTRLSPTEARITWQAQPGASEYVIERRRVGSNEWERIATAPGGTTSLVDDTLDPGAAYVYRASAVNEDGESAYSAEAASQAACAGDCGGEGSVTVDEIIILVNIALGSQQPSACPNGVPAGRDVDITLIVQAVSYALTQCPT